MYGQSELVKPLYSSCSCNISPHCLDWGTNGLVVYGASNAVTICDFACSGGKVGSTLCHHSGPVKSVRWVKQNSATPESEFISTSVDKTAVIWSCTLNSTFEPSAVLKGHTDIVTIADGIYTSESGTKRAMIVATGSVDCTVKIWIRKDSEESFSNVQTLNGGSVSCLCLRLHFLPSLSNVLLACSSDDGKVHLFSEEESEFKSLVSLDNHRDFVWAIDVTLTDKGDLAIVTGSQDNTIRIWRLYSLKNNSSDLDGGEIRLLNKIFSIKGQQFYVELESTIKSHSRGVQGVSWHPGQFSEPGKKLCQPMKFVSASMDCYGILFSLNESENIWNESVHFGGVGQDDSMGLYSCRFSPDGSHLLFHGFQGTFHLWRRSYMEPNSEKSSCSWDSIATTIGGHFNAAVDVQWEPKGEFIFSVSKDQTTRVHGPWIVSGDPKNVSWYQLAWPQVHGYDLSCIAVLSPHMFASGAEEKVVRIFEAPNHFVENCRNMSHLTDKDVCPAEPASFVFAVTQPALGLSNKALHNQSSEQGSQTTGPLGEQFLKLKTLWPEIHKLYGHGNDICALAAHPNGKFLASACKAARPEDAAIIIWDTKTWIKEQELASHTLTVTCMAFSPDGQFLVSVSRDRRWSLFKWNQSNNGDIYELVACTDNKNGVHSRIIWTCTWSHDSQYFATGSRDGKLVVWQAKAGPPASLTVCEFKGQSVTAVAFAPSLVVDNYIIAVGFESGAVSIFSWNANSNVWKKLMELDKNTAHHLSVKKLAFRPTDASCLASCGEDRFVKIYDISAVYKI